MNAYRPADSHCEHCRELGECIRELLERSDEQKAELRRIKLQLHILRAEHQRDTEAFWELAGDNRVSLAPLPNYLEPNGEQQS